MIKYRTGLLQTTGERISLSCVIKFACYGCRLEEVKRVKTIDELANKGKILHKQKTPLNPDNFIREAKEVIFAKNTQLDYGSVLNQGSSNPDYPECESVVSPDDGWTFVCSICGKRNYFSRGFGNL